MAISTQTTATGLNSLELSDTMTASSDNVLKIAAATNALTAGLRQGVVSISSDRTVALTAWDGNPDCGLKMSIYNSAQNGASGGTRGIDMTIRNNSGSSTESWINGISCTAENKTGAGTIATSSAAQFNMKNNGVVSTSNYGVIIQDQSQGTNPAATAMLRFTTGGDNPASGAVPAVINIAAKDTAGFTNLINAESATLDCAVVGGSQGAVAGYFKVVVNGTSYKIPFNAVA